MWSENSSLSARQRRLEEIIFSYEKALDAGQPLDRQQLLNIHAELAGELRSYFADLDRFQPAARSTSPDRDVMLVESFGEYEVLEEIGHGGMGVVLRSRDRDLGQELAFKVMRPEHKDAPTLVRRFLKEAEIGAQLQHPGIVPVHKRGYLPDGRPYFTMRLVQGKTLAALLKYRPSAVELPHFLAIFDQVCRAMEYAHSRRVIHRDLKPANIMVGIHGDVQVMDWGLAKVFGDDGASTLSAEQAPKRDASGVGAGDTGSADELSREGEIMGTPSYMAPEQAQGKVSELDARCDVFSLGAILCEILTGRPPYVGGDVLAKAQAADLSDALVSLDACGADEQRPGLIGLARHCLSSRRDYRPQNAGEVARQLREYVASRNDSADHGLRVAQDEAAAATARAATAERKLKVAYNWLKGAAATLLIAFGLLGWTGLEKTVEPNAPPAPPLQATAKGGLPKRGPARARGAPAKGQEGNRREEQTPLPQAPGHASLPSRDGLAQPGAFRHAYVAARGVMWPPGAGFAQPGAFTPPHGARLNTPAWPTYRSPLPRSAYSQWAGPTVPQSMLADGFAPPGLRSGLGVMEHRPPIRASDPILQNASRYSQSLSSAELLMLNRSAPSMAESLRFAEPLPFNPSTASWGRGTWSAVPEVGSIGRFLGRAAREVRVP